MPLPAISFGWDQISYSTASLLRGDYTLPPALSQTPETFWEEAPGSPEIELGEQATFVHTFNCDYATAVQVGESGSVSRGTEWFDSAGTRKFKILSTTITTGNKGFTAQVRIVSEAINFGLPPPEFHVEVLEFNPALQKHPRYAGLPREVILQITQDCVYAASPEARNTAVQKVLQWDTSGGTPLIGAIGLEAATEMLGKIFQGTETFYLAGYRVSFSTYYSAPIKLNPGGYIEDPVTEGGLPIYYWSTSHDTDGANIFTNLASIKSPQFYQNGLSWLRIADTIEYQRTWFRVTNSWLGGPNGGTTALGDFLGHWDRELYQVNPILPYNTSDPATLV